MKYKYIQQIYSIYDKIHCYIIHINKTINIIKKITNLKMFHLYFTIKMSEVIGRFFKNIDWQRTKNQIIA